MIDIETITAYLAVIHCLLVARAWTPYLYIAIVRNRVPKTATQQRKHDRVHENDDAIAAIVGMAVFTVIITLVLGMRMFYWDILPDWSGDYWRQVYEFFGGRAINTNFNIAFSFGCLAALWGNWRLIPSHDRPNWNWYSAVIYPRRFW